MTITEMPEEIWWNGEVEVSQYFNGDSVGNSITRQSVFEKALLSYDKLKETK